MDNKKDSNIKKYGSEYPSDIDQINLPSKTWCPMPWISLATTPSGGFKPCCEIYGGAFQGNISRYKRSRYLSQIKSELLKGIFPSACCVCKIKEEAGTESKRSRELRKYKGYFGDEVNLAKLEQYNLLELDVRLSNKCNLACITCNPRNSSLIQEETAKNYNNTLDHYQGIFNLVKDKNLSMPYDSQTIDSFIDNISPGCEIYFTGGEPTVLKPVNRMLELLIERGLNKQVRLLFNSNFQSHNPKFISLLQHFEGLMLASIDGIGKRAEYIRYPSTWDDVEYNLINFKKRCPSMDLLLTPTISVLNIFYLNELNSWASENKIRISFNNTLAGPPMLNISILPKNVKETIKNHLTIDQNDKNNIINFMFSQQEEDSAKLTELKNNLEKIDIIRKKDYKTELPKLAEVLCNY